MYPGIKGKTQGDKKLISQAPKAIIRFKIIGPKKIIYTVKEGPEGWSEGIIKATSLINSQSQVKDEGK